MKSVRRFLIKLLSADLNLIENEYNLGIVSMLNQNEKYHPQGFKMNNEVWVFI